MPELRGTTYPEFVAEAEWNLGSAVEQCLLFENEVFNLMSICLFEVERLNVLI